ncbi:MAG: hypothetical protein QOC92_3759 [Acidimicrobiaceae bacterium]|jgi:hypothetical protein
MSAPTGPNRDPRARRIRAALTVLSVAAVAAPFVADAPHVIGRIALNHNEVPGRDRGR